MCQANEIFAEHWLDQAGKLLAAARTSNNLRVIVSLVAAASVLESAVRKIRKGTGSVDFQMVNKVITTTISVMNRLSEERHRVSA